MTMEIEPPGKLIGIVQPCKLPHVRMRVCYHDMYHGEIRHIFVDGMVLLDNGKIVDFNHCCEPLPHSINYGTAHPCPICGEYLGFHNEALHHTVEPKYLKDKGWHKD